MSLRACTESALSETTTEDDLYSRLVSCINNYPSPSIIRQDTEPYEPYSPIGSPPSNLFSEEVSTTSYPQDITGGKKSRRHRQHNYRKTRRHHRKIRGTRRH